MGRYYLGAELAKSRELTTGLRVMGYVLDETTTCRAGQYFMLWLPEHGEIPLSPSTCGGGYVEFVIEDVGPTSSAIMSLEPGTSCFLRGPFGRPFSLDREGQFLLVGGGTGAAPLLMAARELADAGRPASVLEGARNVGRLCYVQEFSKLATTTAFVTEDGSFGHPGRVPDYVERMIAEHEVRNVLTAGPELMMRAVVSMSDRLGVYSEASLVRIIKCADGLCGSCVLDPSGQLVCKEGPVIPGSQLLKSDFGSKTRDSAGRRVVVS